MKKEMILKKYKVAQLYVGYDYKRDDTIDYCMKILIREKHFLKEMKYYLIQMIKLFFIL